MKKLLLCFFFIFFTLYIFLNPNAVIPYSFYVNNLYAAPFNRLIVWLARDVFHLVGPSVPLYNLIVDTVFAYLTILFISTVAFLGSLIWVIFERGRGNYNRLYNLLILILRYFLAVSWIAYGCIKLARLQFPVFTPEMLIQTYGNSSPRDLAWSFMGYSNGYNYFIGVIECGVGLMLFFRRTSTLGNLFGLIILANVMAFNYSFDVNVKILATTLMAMSLCLLTKDLKRLSDFFFRDKSTDPPPKHSGHFKTKWKNNALVAGKCVFIFLVLFFDLHGDLARDKQTRLKTIKAPLYGIYKVETLIRNGDTLQPLTTDTTRWNKLIISSRVSGAIFTMDDNLKYINVKIDTLKKTLVLRSNSNPSDEYHLTYAQLKPGELIFHGTLNKDSLQIILHKIDLHKLPLMRRDFRWIIDRHYSN